MNPQSLIKFLSAILMTFASVGCSTQSSGGSTGGSPAGQGSAPREGNQNDRGRTAPWQCAVQFENGIVACGVYTSNYSDDLLQQDCLAIPGEIVQKCPADRFQVTCLVRGEGAEVRFRMAGTPEQRQEMVQICQSNNGQVQQ